MKSIVKIVKRVKEQSSEPLPPQEIKEKKAPTEREITSTIKSWIADLEQQKRLAERTTWDLLTKFAQ